MKYLKLYESYELSDSIKRMNKKYIEFAEILTAEIFDDFNIIEVQDLPEMRRNIAYPYVLDDDIKKEILGKIGGGKYWYYKHDEREGANYTLKDKIDRLIITNLNGEDIAGIKKELEDIRSIVSGRIGIIYMHTTTFNPHFKPSYDSLTDITTYPLVNTIQIQIYPDPKNHKAFIKV